MQHLQKTGEGVRLAAPIRIAVPFDGHLAAASGASLLLLFQESAAPAPPGWPRCCAAHRPVPLRLRCCSASMQLMLLPGGSLASSNRSREQPPVALLQHRSTRWPARTGRKAGDHQRREDFSVSRHDRRASASAARAPGESVFGEHANDGVPLAWPPVPGVPAES